jgi:hypothetical protein
MNILQNELKKHINKLVRPLQDEDELRVTLKAKLTKKEFKLLECWAKDEDIEALKLKLHLDDDKYQELSSKLVKKLNQEKIKQQICN